MNKNLYRVVFNKARGLLMVVGEISAAQGKGQGRVRGGARSRALRIRAATLKPGPAAVLLALSAQCLFSTWAQAQIIADPSAPRSQQPTVLNAPNGVPLVNIQTPSAGGVSRNTYSQFDVQQRGAILNNARTDTQTQLGGWVQGNPWLANGGARVILNEVNASNPSLLQGYVEVAGSRAQVVIANPAGITCDGCGFINADRATLSTGTPILNGGNLEGYRVQRGTVTVQGAGLDARQTDFTDIIARAVQVNAGIWANTLKITIGPNQVSADQAQATPATGIGPAPGFAIDVGQLGGMYAGKITLVGTEAGVGVRNAGQIGASAGEVIVTSDGRLENSGRITSTGNTQLDAQGGLQNSGTVYAQGDSTLSTRADIDNSGTIAAQGNTTLSATGAASRIASTSGSVLGAGVQSDGRLGAQGGLTLNATQTITAQGQTLSAGDQRLAAQTINLSGSQTSAPNLSLEASTGDIDATGATLVASQTLSANAGQTLRTDLAHIAAPQISIRARDLSNSGGEIIQTGATDLTLQLPGRLDNTQGRIASNGRDLVVNAATLINTDGQIEHAGNGTLAISATTFDGARGTLSGNGALDLHAQTATLDGGNTAAQHIAINTAILSNRNGSIMQSGTGPGAIQASTRLDNHGGTLVSNGDLLIQAGDLINQGGTVQATGNSALTVTATGMLDNSAQGLLGAGGDARVNAQEIHNVQGRISAGGTLQATAAQALDNRQGTVVANGDLTLSADRIHNGQGTLGSAQGSVAASATGGSLDNAAGRIQAAQHLTLAGTGLANTDGVLSGQDVQLDSRGQTLDNARGTIAARGTLDIQSGDLNNDAGFIGAQGNLSAASTAIHNTQGGTLSSAAALTLQGTGLDNHGGQVQALGDITVQASGGTVDNSASLMRAGQTLTLDADRLVNTQTQGVNQGIEGQSVHITARDIDNQTGAIRANDALTLTSSGNLRNQGQLLAGQTLRIDAAGIDNTATGEISAQNTQLSTPGTLDNRGLIDGSETHISANTINNLGSGRIYGDHIALGASALNNSAENGTAAVIAARQRLDLGVKTLSNQDKALLFSAGDLALGGGLDAHGKATGQATQFINLGADIEALGNLQASAADLRNLNAGLVTRQVADAPVYQEFVQPRNSADQYAVGQCSGIGGGQDANSCAGYPGTFEDYTWFKVNTTVSRTQVVTTRPGQIHAGGAMLLDGALSNQDSHIVAGGTLTITGSSLQNLATQGQDVSTHAGAAQFTEVVTCGTLRSSHCREWYPPSPYNPAPAYGTPYNLPTTQLLQNTAPQNSGTQISARTPLGTIAAPAAGISPGQAAGALNEVTALHPISATGPATVIRTGNVDTILPNNRLFQPNPDPAGRYLIETDPRFANYRAWLGSDYLLAQLEFDPATTQKRLGDGFYEQRLVREQVAQLTGRRFLAGYTSDEAQYRALMDHGATYARAQQLRPGVALSAAQMAALTSDIVWLVEQDITLPDGRRTKALVPQLYVRVRGGDLDGAGSLLAGDSVRFQLGGDLVNSGSIQGRRLVALDAENIRNLGGRIQGADIALNARSDLDHLGGRIGASDRLLMRAGRDLNIASTTRDTRSAPSPQGAGSDFRRTQIERVASLYVSHPDGVLLAQAGRDLTLRAAQIGHDGESGLTLLDAGRDLRLDSLRTGEQHNSVRDAANFLKQGHSEDIGTAMEARGDIQLRAGRDLSARAAHVNSAQGSVAAQAGRDLQLAAGSAERNLDEGHRSSHGNALHRSTVTTRDALSETQARASTFSGDRVHLQGGRDLTIEGSNVVGERAATLTAGRDLAIQAATHTRRELHSKQTQTHGFLSGGSFGISYGERRISSIQDQTRHSQQDARSLIGSTQGSLDIRAGENARVQGSDLSAAEDITLSARQIRIQPGDDSAQGRYTQQMQQNGLTLALGGSVVNAAQTVQGMQGAARDSGNSRVKALAAATATLAAANAARDVAQNGLSVSLSLTAGHSESESTQTNTQHNHSASRLQAGRDLSLSATGDKDSRITVTGSDLRAGRDARLSADHAITLQAAQDSEAQHSESHSMSAQAGVAVAASSNGGVALGVTASGSLGRGQSDGDGITQRNTHVDAGRQLSLHSGGDTTLRGAVARAGQVRADIGGDLRIESLQDTARFASRDQRVSASATFGYGANVSASYGQSDLKSDYASVQAQSGIQAGDGGFDLTVQGNTDLTGAVIASSQQAIDQHRNRLSTGTLTYRDLHNHAEYQGSSLGLSASASTGGKAGDPSGGKDQGPGGTDLINAGQGSGVSDGKYGLAKAIAGNLLNNGHTARDDASLTRSAISGGTITRSAQDGTSLATLSRDTAQTHRALQEQDVQQLARDAQVKQAFKQAVFQEAVKFTDEAYRVSFLEKARMYKVARDPESGEIIRDKDNKPVKTELSDMDKKALKPQPGGKLNVFTNGIFNDDAAAAGYAVQMSELPPGQDVYLVYYPKADDAISELLVAGYQKFMEGNIGDLANATQEIKRLMEQYGADGLNLTGHSRGAMTIGNAMEALSSQTGIQGVLYNTNIKFVGPAYSAQATANMLDRMSNGNHSKVLLQNHGDDFVGTLIGGNPVTFETRPAESSMLNEWVKMFGGAPTVHSCYGTGAVSKDCKPIYGTPITIEIPSMWNRQHGDKP